MPLYCGCKSRLPLTTNSRAKAACSLWEEIVPLPTWLPLTPPWLGRGGQGRRPDGQAGIQAEAPTCQVRWQWSPFIYLAQFGWSSGYHLKVSVLLGGPFWLHRAGFSWGIFLGLHLALLQHKVCDRWTDEA